ncbi:MAG: transglutaminase domain-containing protein [Eubacterium sp.]|nr:transglutaminase domain-containing protein [Eubacterium sp.]
MGKVSKVFIIIAAIAALGAVGAVVYNIFMTQKQSQTLDSYIDKTEERYAESLKKEDEFIEDGAVIGDVYTIRSTKAISDAYIAGDPSNLGEEDKKTYDLAKEILERETKGCTTLYEKEKKIYEWICKNIKHNEGSSTMALRGTEVYPLDTPYGVLNGGYAVCVGYATTFRLFMNMLGADCHIPHNDGHSWDEVQLDDGEWYFVDIYSSAGNNSIDYQYFNMDEMAAEGMTDSSCYSHLPTAKGRKYLYPVQIGKKINDMFEIPKRIKEAYDKKESCVSMIFEKEPTEDESNIINAITSVIDSHISMDNSENSYTSLSYCWYRDEQDHLIYAVYITRSEYGENIDTDSPDVKKLKKIIDKLFGETTDAFSPEESGSEEGGIDYDKKKGL